MKDIEGYSSGVWAVRSGAKSTRRSGVFSQQREAPLALVAVHNFEAVLALPNQGGNVVSGLRGELACKEGALRTQGVGVFGHLLLAALRRQLCGRHKLGGRGLYGGGVAAVACGHAQQSQPANLFCAHLRCRTGPCSITLSGCFHSEHKYS